MRIAITGGVGEGKSTVLGYLSELGYTVASADAVARQVFDQDEVQQGLARLLGRAGAVRPAEIREAILKTPSLRRNVNALMHPMIVQELNKIPATFVEVPLLFETCLQGEFESVWVVSCGLEAQLDRLEKRLGPEQARLLVATQLASAVKEVFADYVIRTNRPERLVFEDVRVIASKVVCE